MLSTGSSADNAPPAELEEVPCLLLRMPTCSPKARQWGPGTSSLVPRARRVGAAHPSPVKKRMSRRRGRPLPPSQGSDTGVSTQAPEHSTAIEVKLEPAASLILKKPKVSPRRRKQVRSHIYCQSLPLSPQGCVCCLLYANKSVDLHFWELLANLSSS